MKWHYLIKSTNIWRRKRRKNGIYTGGLDKLKAEQDRPVFLFSTRKLQFTFNLEYVYGNFNAAIDSS